MLLPKIKLSGEIGGKKQEFSNQSQFPEQKRNHEFLPRLWAQRKVAYLVDSVRLNGEDKELIDEIVRLSKKYGIMTPYTSFLVLEDDQPVAAAPRLRARAVRSGRRLDTQMQSLSRFDAKGASSGADAVRAGRVLQAMKLGEREDKDSESIKRVGDKTFYLRNGAWVDSEYDKQTETEEIEYGGDAYFDLIAQQPELSKYLAIGKHAILCYKAKCYKITPKKSK